MSKISSAELEAVLSSSKIVYSESEIDAALCVMAASINNDLRDHDPIFICVLNGALMMYGQLMKKITIPSRMDAVHVARYGDEKVGSELQWLSYPSLDLDGQVVVLLDDVLEGGITLSEIAKYCYSKNAKQVITGVLINKKITRENGGLEQVDYAALEMESGFLIGFGLDYKGYLRNTRDIYMLEDGA